MGNCINNEGSVAEAANHESKAINHVRTKSKLPKPSDVPPTDPEGPWSAEEQDYRDALKAIVVDLLERCAKVITARRAEFTRVAGLAKKKSPLQLMAPQHFEAVLRSTLNLPKNAENLQAASEEETYSLLLRYAGESHFKKDVPIKTVVSQITEAARLTAAELRHAMELCSQLAKTDNRQSDSPQLLSVFADGFDIIFKDISPTDPQVFFSNIDKYTAHKQWTLFA